MGAKEFYYRRIQENPGIDNIQLMEEYAKHIIEINFCDGLSTDFNSLTIRQLEKIHENIKMCVDWVNS